MRPFPLVLVLSLAACAPAAVPPGGDAPPVVGTGVEASPTEALEAVGFNLDWLDHLGEDVVHGGDTLRFVHIYAEPGPDGDWVFVGDDDEGIACVDDAARAAVVYLRHFERTGDERSRRHGAALLRFVRFMQAESGLFYNFVWDRGLRVNREHPNSVADEVSWWTARAVWALGEGARVLRDVDPAEAAAAAAAVRRVEPHLDRLLARYPEVRPVAPPAGGEARPFPTWLLYKTASDATSELLLGLVALQEAEPTPRGGERVRKFAEGISTVRFGTVGTFPYGGFASWVGGWHGWGNSQAQALAGAARLGLAPGALAAAREEAVTLIPRLLVEGWLHALDYATEGVQPFEQIAYDVRPAAVGLVRLSEATGDERFAVQAGLAASWFHGTNPAGVVMADPATGRGYDGILSPTEVNWNAGAESTVEAQLTLLEVASSPLAASWSRAAADPPRSATWQHRPVRYRRFVGPREAVVVLDPEAGATHLFVGRDATSFLESATPR